MAYSVIVLYSMMKAPDDENGELDRFTCLDLQAKERNR